MSSKQSLLIERVLLEVGEFVAEEFEELVGSMFLILQLLQVTRMKSFGGNLLLYTLPASGSSRGDRKCSKRKETVNALSERP